MKKFISAIAALSLCAAMLTGCGGGGSAELQDETTAAPAATTTAAETKDNTEDTAKTEAEEDIVDETDPEDEIVDDNNNASEEADSGDAKLEFASLDEFAEYDITSLPYEKVKAEDSNTYGFIKTLEGADGFYLDVESTDGTMNMSLAFEDKNIAMDVVDETGTRVVVLITDYTMYMFDPSSMTGYYFDVDESIFNEYNTEDMLSQINIDESKLSTAEDVESCKVNIGGTDYVFEYASGSGFLYETDGKMYAIVSTDPSIDITALIVNEFSGHVPAGAFDIPDGYEMMDFSALFSMGE